MRGTDAMEHAFQIVKAVKQAKREGYSLDVARMKFPLLADYDCIDQVWRLVADPSQNKKRR